MLAEIALVLACNAQQKPPAAAVHPVVDDDYGTTVTDNYRWMEDMKSPEPAEWMRAQNAYTLQSIPGRAQMLRDIQTYENARTNVDQLEFYGGRYFYRKLVAGEDNHKWLEVHQLPHTRRS